MTESIASTRLDPVQVWSAEPPRLDYVLPGLVRGTVGNIVAAGGTGKSFAMLATALGVAVGTDVGDIWGEQPVQGGAVFLSLEDPDAALRIRLHALRNMVGEDERSRAAHDLHVLSCAGRGTAFAEAGPGGTPKLSDFVGELRDYLTSVRARLLVVDTLNRALGGLGENEAGTMGWVMGQIEVLASTAGCAVVLCHHVSKAALVASASGEAHSARGSSVITDNSRWQCNLSVMSAREDGFEPQEDRERRRYVRLDFSKLNYGGPLQARWLRRGDGGTLRYGEPPRKKAPAGSSPRPRAR